MTTTAAHTDPTSPAMMRVFLAAEVAFVTLAIILALRVVDGVLRHGAAWMLPLAAVAGLLLADFVSGILHFLADNFAEADTPIVGPTFVRPFREHHADPLAITTHSFVYANGGPTLFSLPVVTPVALLVPVEESLVATGLGAFTLFLMVPLWLTNQIHKWAHMPAPHPLVRLLQRSRLILGNAHHDVHHKSPFDTYYCITVGFWNRPLERINFWERLERSIRRWVPGTDPVSRVARDAMGRTVVPASAARAP